jgi:hypothetical protein
MQNIALPLLTALLGQAQDNAVATNSAAGIDLSKSQALKRRTDAGAFSCPHLLFAVGGMGEP